MKVPTLLWVEQLNKLTTPEFVKYARKEQKSFEKRWKKYYDRKVIR